MPPVEGTLPSGRTQERDTRGLDPRAQRARIEAEFRRNDLGTTAATAAIVLVWSVAAAYYMLVPSEYVSRWSLILPAANSGSSVTLESIGQSTTNPGQPFGSVQLSPKVIYREIASSDQVRNAAAASLGVQPQQFGRVRVRLIDETSLMIFQINGGSAEIAQSRGRAMIAAFEAQLDALRRDEFNKRAMMMRENLKIYQANLDRGRERIIEFQMATGLLSINQFTEASSSAEAMRRRLSERRAELDKVTTEQMTLRNRLGFEPRAAAAGLRLASDPTFSRLASAYGEASALLHENAMRYGPSHPALNIAQMRVDGVLSEIDKIARASEIDRSVDLRSLVLFMNGSQQSDLLRVVVANEAIVSGHTREVAALENALQQLEADVRRMGGDAARLEALKKDHLVAEAVFTSAAARLDTNRTDLYSSYPLVQVLAQPDMAENRSQPRLSYAIAAGTLGTLLVLLALGAAWVRGRFSRTRLKSG